MSTPVQLWPLGQVSLLITDVSRAEAFYGETLGLPHVFTFGDLAFFWAGEVRIYLQRVAERDWKPGSVLYFLVDDIEAAHRELLRRGVTFAGVPHLIYRDAATNLEEWMAFFDDSEGNMLAVMSRIHGPTPLGGRSPSGPEPGRGNDGMLDCPPSHLAPVDDSRVGRPRSPFLALGPEGPRKVDHRLSSWMPQRADRDPAWRPREAPDHGSLGAGCSHVAPDLAADATEQRQSDRSLAVAVKPGDELRAHDRWTDRRSGVRHVGS